MFLGPCVMEGGRKIRNACFLPFFHPTGPLLCFVYIEVGLNLMNKTTQERNERGVCLFY